MFPPRRRLGGDKWPAENESGRGNPKVDRPLGPQFDVVALTAAQEQEQEHDLQGRYRVLEKERRRVVALLGI